MSAREPDPALAALAEQVAGPHLVRTAGCEARRRAAEQYRARAADEAVTDALARIAPRGPRLVREAGR